MDEQQLHALSDEELRTRAKEMRSSEILHAVIIGFLVGVIIFSVFYDAIGVSILISLFLIFKVFHRPERNRALKQVLAERGLDR